METVLPLAQDTQNYILVLTLNKKRFVVGRRWRVVKTQRNIMKEIRRIGLQEKLDVVAIRQSDAIQAGFAPKTPLQLQGCYSLTVVLASLLEGACITVILLGQRGDSAEYTLRPLFYVNSWLLGALFVLAADNLIYAAQKRSLTIGIFGALHTYGRQLNWNCHIHLSWTTGGIHADGNWKAMRFDLPKVRSRWMWNVSQFLLEAWASLTLPRRWLISVIMMSRNALC